MVKYELNNIEIETSKLLILSEIGTSRRNISFIIVGIQKRN